MDESGDLGFEFGKKKTSDYFIITVLFIDGSKRIIEKMVKKTHSELAKKNKKKSWDIACST